MEIVGEKIRMSLFVIKSVNSQTHFSARKRSIVAAIKEQFKRRQRIRAKQTRAAELERLPLVSTEDKYSEKTSSAAFIDERSALLRDFIDFHYIFLQLRHKRKTSNRLDVHVDILSGKKLLHIGFIHPPLSL